MRTSPLASWSTLIGAPASSAQASRYSLGTVIWPFSPSRIVVRDATGNGESEREVRRFSLLWQDNPTNRTLPRQSIVTSETSNLQHMSEYAKPPRWSGLFPLVWRQRVPDVPGTSFLVSSDGIMGNLLPGELLRCTGALSLRARRSEAA